VLALVALALIAAASPGPTPAVTAQPPLRLEDLPPPPPSPTPAGPVLPLYEALSVVKAQNPDLEVLRDRVVQAQVNLLRAWDALKPTLTGGLTYTRNSSSASISVPVGVTPAGQPIFTTFDTQLLNSFAGNLAFNWTLFNGRVFPAKDTAELQIEVAKLSVAQLRRELYLSVAASYLTGVGYREFWVMQLRQSRNTRTHAEQAAARYEAGTLQRSAALRARIDVLRADEEARRAQIQYENSKSQVAQLLDRRDIAFELATPAALPDPAGSYAELRQKALVERPEMAIVKANERIAENLKTDAWLQFLPTLGLNWVGRYNNAAGFANENYTWAAAMVLTIPIYDGGFRYASLKDADAKLAEAKAQTRGQASRIEDEVRRAQQDLDGARAVLVEASQQVDLARETESLVRAQFEAGTAAQVEVSDAVNALQDAEANVVRERLNVQLAALRLARAVGTFDP
jgi:outer membrane protein TolC